MKVIVGITGATGAVYAARLIDVLISSDCEVHCVASRHGSEVMSYELGEERTASLLAKVHRVYDPDDMWGAIASGSYRFDAMIVVPCSMKTLAAIACGLSDSLLLRAADVSLKERRKLILVPRETPYSSIHLKNMLALSEIGVDIVPASPGFYHRPRTIEQLVDMFVMRLCDRLGIETELSDRWGAEEADRS